MVILIKFYCCIPLILMLVTIYLLKRMKNKKENFREIEGEIVDIFETTSTIKLSSGEHKAVSPIVKFNLNGNEFKFVGKYYSTSMKVGMKVKVLYDKNNPEKALIKKGLFFAPLITGILSIIFIIPVIIYLILKSKGIVMF